MENRKQSLGDLLNLIKYPLLTEKSINLYSDRQYTFIVARSLTKTEIKYTIENLYSVEIDAINTCTLPTKIKRVGKFSGKKALYKKAYITLKEGYSITGVFN